MNNEIRARLEEMGDLQSRISLLTNELDDKVVSAAKRYIVALLEDDDSNCPNEFANFGWQVSKDGIRISVNWNDTWTNDDGYFSFPASFVYNWQELIKFEERRKEEKKLKEKEMKEYEIKAMRERLKRAEEEFGVIVE